MSDRGTEFTGRIWTELMELLGIQQLPTSPYNPQGNGIVERSHRTVSNMIRARLVNRDYRRWVDVLPGVKFAYNEMEQGRHRYSASQVMWGQGMNLPTDLLHGTRSVGEQDRHQFVQNIGKELRGIREKVCSFNKNREKIATIPFREGDFILVHQQPMERMHNLSPKWRGPYKVTKVPNPFQAQYQDEEK